jgi:hypothetical protein
VSVTQRAKREAKTDYLERTGFVNLQNEVCGQCELCSTVALGSLLRVVESAGRLRCVCRRCAQRLDPKL